MTSGRRLGCVAVVPLTTGKTCCNSFMLGDDGRAEENGIARMSADKRDSMMADDTPALCDVDL